MYYSLHSVSEVITKVRSLSTYNFLFYLHEWVRENDDKVDSWHYRIYVCTVECVYEKYQKLNVCIWQSTDLPRASLSLLAGHKKSYWQAWQNWSWKRDENWVRVFFVERLHNYYSLCMSESDGFDDDSLAKKKECENIKSRLRWIFWHKIFKHMRKITFFFGLIRTRAIFVCSSGMCTEHTLMTKFKQFFNYFNTYQQMFKKMCKHWVIHVFYLINIRHFVNTRLGGKSA